LLGDRQTATELRSIVGARRDGSQCKVMDGAHIFVSALGELQDRIVYQDSKSSEEKQKDRYFASAIVRVFWFM
jgi:hypothetical protein